MTTQIITTVLTFLLGGVLGGFIQTVYSYKKEILSNIWTKRFEAYTHIWEISGILPKFPEDREVTYKNLYDACIKIKDWYFKNGGIILSKKSRAVYEQLQEHLAALSANQSDEKLAQADYDLMRGLFSSLRSQLTNDLTSRSSSLM